MTGRLQIKKGYYYIILNYKDMSGKYKQKWISTKLPEQNNKRKAERLLRDSLTNYQSSELNKNILVESALTMPDLIREWLSVKETTIRANSYESYRVTAETQVIPYFENLKVLVKDLEAAHIQRYFTTKTKEKIAQSTIIKHNTIIHGSLEYAIKVLGIVEDNPADRVTLPKKQKRVPTFYADDQIKELLQLSQGTILEVPVRLSVTYGLRRSEVMGLKWSSVDFKEKTLIIKHTAVKCGGETLYDDVVKTASSLRTFPLIPVIEVFLLKQKEQQKMYKKKLGNTYQKSDYICVWEDGHPISPDYISRAFRKFLKAQGLPHIRFHDLRHSSASLLINMGFTLKEVQDWLGHSDISSTNIYAHLLYKSKEKMANRVGEALSF